MMQAKNICSFLRCETIKYIEMAGNICSFLCSETIKYIEITGNINESVGHVIVQKTSLRKNYSRLNKHENYSGNKKKMSILSFLRGST